MVCKYILLVDKTDGRVFHLWISRAVFPATKLSTDDPRGYTGLVQDLSAGVFHNASVAKHCQNQRSQLSRDQASHSAQASISKR